jgi:hypothetical protein
MCYLELEQSDSQRDFLLLQQIQPSLELGCPLAIQLVILPDEV